MCFQAESLFALDLDDLAVVDNDFHRAEPDALERLHDPLAHSGRNGFGYFQIRIPFDLFHCLLTV